MGPQSVESTVEQSVDNISYLAEISLDETIDNCDK